MSRPKGRPTPKGEPVESRGKTRTCPYCAETIKATAVVCPFCRSDLVHTRRNTETPDVQARSGILDGVRLGLGMFIVLPLLIVVVFFLFSEFGLGDILHAILTWIGELQTQ